MLRRTPPVHALVLLLLAGAVGSFVGTARPAGADAPAVSATRLRIELTTTADWATLRFEGLSFPAVRTLAADPADRVTRTGDAWTVVDGDGDGSRIELDVVAAELGGRPTFEVTLDQGLGGSTAVEVVDGSRDEPVVVQLATGDSAGGRLGDARSLDRSELLGVDELVLPKVDQRRLVLAAYYPWFAREGNPSHRMAEDPVQPRSAWDLDDVRSHVAQAGAAGIDGFVVSWSGARDDGRQLDHVLQASAEQGRTATVYLETAEARGLLGGTDEATVKRWLDEALARSSHPGFLSAADGTPIVFVFAMERLPADAWSRLVADTAARGRPVHLVGDADPATHGSALWGWHRYGASGTPDQLTSLWRSMAHRVRGPHLLDPGQANRLVVATVSPGYDDTKLRGNQNPVIPREGGARYAATWAAARLADPDVVLITSWNEWFEGTSVEPGTVNGDLALRQTSEQSAAWKAGAGQEPAPGDDPPPTTTTTQPPPAPPADTGRCRLLWLLCPTSPLLQLLS